MVHHRCWSGVTDMTVLWMAGAKPSTPQTLICIFQCPNHRTAHVVLIELKHVMLFTFGVVGMEVMVFVFGALGSCRPVVV